MQLKLSMMLTDEFPDCKQTALQKLEELLGEEKIDEHRESIQCIMDLVDKEMEVFHCKMNKY